MGKLQSKHAAECLLVSAQIDSALEEQIWKKKSSLDLANYNMDPSLSELSVCLDEKCGSIPLRVDLPPLTGETETSKVLKLDQMLEQGTTDKTYKANNLDIEEIECGVQFEGKENSKQEWSFTLYDFDGHGCITKEDLSSLLKALYDAVGSSIRLPPNGAKTLKLRLTVGQDHTHIRAISSLTDGKCKNNSQGNRPRTCKESPRRQPQQIQRLNNLTGGNVKVTNQQAQSGVGDGGAVDTEQATGCTEVVSKPQSGDKTHMPHHASGRSKVKQSRRQHDDCPWSGEKSKHHKRRQRDKAQSPGKSRSSSKTPQLQTPPVMTSTPAPVMPKHDAKTDSTATKSSETPAATTGCGESQDRRNYYLDLAGLDSSKVNNNATSTPQPAVQEQTGQPHAARCESGGRDKQAVEPGRGRASSQPHGHHHTSLGAQLRASSYEPQSNTRLEPKPSAAAAAEDGGTKSPRKHGQHRSVPVSDPVTAGAPSAHHQRRHRHREKHHDLAMQQVAAWIQRQNVWHVEQEHVIVQKHEHHHIHEHHHHHHYHHYYEA